MSRTLLAIPLLITAAFALAGCATQESFCVPVMRPAAVDLGQHDLVAVDRFSGDGGEVLNQEMTTALRQVVNPLTKQADFEVVHRADVDRMIDDMRRYPGSNLETADSPVAKWKRARIQIAGNVETHRVQEECAVETWVDPHGVAHRTKTRCADARVAVTIEAHDGEANKLFDRVRLDEHAAGKTQAVDGEPDPIDHEALLAAARNRVVQEYLQRVTPHLENVAVSLYTDGDLPQLQVGNGFARTGDWKAALDRYQSALEIATGEHADVRYKALHNAGVAYLYTDRFDEAKSSLQEAYALGQEQVSLQQLQMVAQRQQDFETLQQQGNRQTAAPAR